MRKLVTWLLVTLGIAALVRRLRRREEPVEIAPATPTEDPADELRRKLAESRTEESTPGAAPEAVSTPGDEASVDERRAGVHEQGRATLQEMQPPPEGAPESQSQEP